MPEEWGERGGRRRIHSSDKGFGTLLSLQEDRAAGGGECTFGRRDIPCPLRGWIEDGEVGHTLTYARRSHSTVVGLLVAIFLESPILFVVYSRY